MFELYKSKVKKLCPDKFNCYVDLVCHDMVTDAGRDTTHKRKFKAPSLQTQCRKNAVPPENMGLKGKKFEDFRQQKSKILF